jgi:hypothetical protein
MPLWLLGADLGGSGSFKFSIMVNDTPAATVNESLPGLGCKLWAYSLKRV